MGDGSHSGGEADTHLRIILAALEEFRRSGFKGSSTRVIAERAGVNEVTLFRHFGNKLDLLREAVDYGLREIHIPDDLHPYLELPMEDGLRAFVRDYLTQFNSKSDVLMLSFSESFAHPEMIGLIKTFMLRLRRNVRTYFEQLAQQGKMRDADYAVMTHLLVSAVTSAAAYRRRAPVEAMAEFTDERMTEGLVDIFVSAYGLHDRGPGSQEATDRG